jgi:hypothetical protein
MQNQLPPIGTELSGRHKGSALKATIVPSRPEPRQGEVEFNGKRYRSLTAAAVAATGRSTNGWIFWKLADGSPLRS